MKGSEDAIEPGFHERDTVLSPEIHRRRDRLVARMDHKRLDAIVVASESNVKYLTGYRSNTWANRARPIVCVLLSSGEVTCFVSAGEATSLEQGAVDVAVIPYRKPAVVQSGDQMELEFIRAATRALALLLIAQGTRSVGLELGSHFLPGLSYAAISELASSIGPAQFVDVSQELWRLRRTKSPYEVQALTKAAKALGEAYALFELSIHPGLSEYELHRCLVRAAMNAGVDQVSYTSVVADARISAVGNLTTRKWRPGNLLSVDAGVVVDGYWADFSRLYAAEPLAPGLAAAYHGLVERLRGARAAVKVGQTASHLARLLSADSEGDVGSTFGRQGHGIGLDLTEPPSLDPLDTTVLSVGMTLCMEPTSFVEGVGFLVAEEEVVVTEHGTDLISPKFPSELMVLA